MSAVVKVSQDGRVGIIQMNRPERYTALNAQMATAVISAAESFDAGEEIGCIVLTGNEKAFAAGADISEMAGMSAADMSRTNISPNGIALRICAHPKQQRSMALPTAAGARS